MSEPTLASTWYAASGVAITDRLLEWPPDVFALTNLVLARAEAFRYVLTVKDWPPSGFGDWPQAVEEASRRWSAWAEDPTGAIPDLVASQWRVFCEDAEVPIEQVALRRDHRVCEALLTLHAIADEACAGLGVALDSSSPEGCVYRARGRELLARTGSLARIDARLLRVLPKVITPPTVRPTFSRYACVQGPGIDVGWHKIPARHRGTDLRSEYATLLLLPWPLRVQAADFHSVGLCSGWARTRTDSSSMRQPKDLILTCCIGCWSPLAKRRAASMSCCCPRVQSTRARSTTSKGF